MQSSGDFSLAAIVEFRSNMLVEGSVVVVNGEFVPASFINS